MQNETTIDNPYLLMTPGPLSTSRRVKQAMMRDWCTWDDDYNHSVVQVIRQQLLSLAGAEVGYTSVLMQGSGTFSVEACIGAAVPAHGKLLVLSNGAYGQRIAEIARYLKIPVEVLDSGEVARPDMASLVKRLEDDPAITHIAMVHVETTTGMQNDLQAVGALAKQFGKVFIVDAMSSFGGIPINMPALHIDYLISSANKCIQGVPGFGFVIARKALLVETEGNARSLSLDLYRQWQTMEQGQGKWRFTSPTHTVRAFAEALQELAEEGGIAARHQRYTDNQRTLAAGMRERGFRTLLMDEIQSPIITSFYTPENPQFSFKRFYQALKQQGFVIYPGKVSAADTFRIGNIGVIEPRDIEAFLTAVDAAIYWRKGCA